MRLKIRFHGCVCSAHLGMVWSCHHVVPMLCLPTLIFRLLPDGIYKSTTLREGPVSAPALANLVVPFVFWFALRKGSEHADWVPSRWNPTRRCTPEPHLTCSGHYWTLLDALCVPSTGQDAQIKRLEWAAPVVPHSLLTQMWPMATPADCLLILSHEAAHEKSSCTADKDRFAFIPSWFLFILCKGLILFVSERCWQCRSLTWTHPSSVALTGKSGL